MTALYTFAQSLLAPFIAPVFLAFFALAPVIILLYLLKLRRTPVIISSTLLWHKSLQDLTANAPFQRLRKNLLLLLQLIILTALVLALARPFVKASGTGGNDLCVLIDRSASMQTDEAGKTRLEIAKEKALEMVDEMAGDDKMMLVAFARTGDVLCELTSNRPRLRAAIRDIQPTDTSTHIRDAVLVASSLRAGTAAGVRAGLPNGVTDLRIVVISDGKIADLHDVGPRAFDVSFLQVGRNSENTGIITFNVRDPLDGGERQCLVGVRNDRDIQFDGTLTLLLDNETLAVEEVSVPPKGVGEVVFALPNIETGILTASLNHHDPLTDTDPTPTQFDSLPVDDTAWLILRPGPQVRTLLVAEDNSAGAFFLKKVMALNPRIELSAIAPAAFSDAAGYDLVIFDSFAPEQMDACAKVPLVLFVNALPPIKGLGAQGVIENPPILATDSEHPVMRFLNPSNVTIKKAQRLVLPEGGRPLISTQGAPLLADVSRGGQQILVLAFDLADSNWPIRLSFPLFIQNLIAWTPNAAAAGEPYIAAGETFSIAPSVTDSQTDSATVTLPGGTTETVKLDPARPIFFGNTERVGIYRVKCGEREDLHAANLLDSVESAITPAESLNIGRSMVDAQKGAVQQNRELWTWFVLGALVVLSLEWYIYSRRAWL